MSRRRRLLAVAIVGSYVMLFAGFVAAQVGIRVNVSASVPPGVYWVTDEEPSQGDYVAVCPPATDAIRLAMDRGYVPAGRCESGARELLKVLAAQRGDYVGITIEGVTINGVTWPGSVPLTADLAGRRLPRARIVDRALSDREVLVMSEDCPPGFDSRYLGPLPAQSVAGVARPLALW